MKVVVIGAAGLLGAVTVREWRDHGYDVTALTRADLDVTDAKAVNELVPALAPDLIINCTAYNRVDDAEEEPSTALAVNTWAVRSLARAAARARAIFVHYSTDFVFDGATDRPYTEGDPPNPQSAYGMSKLLGEWFALEAGHPDPEGRSYVLRVESLFGGATSRSTLDRMREQMGAGVTVNAFTDRTVSPSYVFDVARATRELVTMRAPAGLYHCVNSGKATWHEVADALRAAAYPEARIAGVSTAAVSLKARRPAFAALSNGKLRTLGIQMPEWTAALRRHLDQTP